MTQLITINNIRYVAAYSKTGKSVTFIQASISDAITHVHPITKRVKSLKIEDAINITEEAAQLITNSVYKQSYLNDKLAQKTHFEKSTPYHRMLMDLQKQRSVTHFINIHPSYKVEAELAMSIFPEDTELARIYDKFCSLPSNGNKHRNSLSECLSKYYNNYYFIAKMHERLQSQFENK